MFCLLPLPSNNPSFLRPLVPRHPQTQSKLQGVVEMEATQSEQGEDEFIDIEVTPFSNPSKSSPSSRDFEFQMASSTHQKEATTPSPADELFYNGKLLPLHLPPRLQMVQKLLQNSLSTTFHVTQNHAYEEEPASRSFTAPPTSSNTPLESCNISPVESCRVSCELNPDEYFFHWSTEVSSFIGGGGGGGGGETIDAHLSKRAWSNKIRLIKQSSLLTQKLKSSRAYLKSLFMRSACSDEVNCAKSRAKEYVSKYIKLVKRGPFGQMENESQKQAAASSSTTSSCTMKSMLDREMDDQVSFTCHRKSFSGAIKRHCTSKCYSSSSGSGSGSASSGASSSCSSSSSSFSLKNPSGFGEINVLKRSISANSEVENSIQGAIAHCKKSQLNCSEPKIPPPPPPPPASEIRACLVSASRVAACGGDNGRPEISRI